MAEAVNDGGMTRREFLYYVWGASMALFAAQATGLIIWFAIPRFRAGQFGGSFSIPADALPEVNAPPVNFPDGRFWLVRLDSTSDEGTERMYTVEGEEPIVGVAAIYKVCTHLGCIYDWNTANQRFECPCHGSKYRLDGRRIESPAPRNLDRFMLTAVDTQGNELAVSSTVSVEGSEVYAALELPADTVSLDVNTGARLDGATQVLICDLRNNCP